MRSEWPLVGRGDEHRLIIDAVFGEAHGGAVLAGQPGVGKTRLAAETIVEGEQRGYSVERAIATRSASTVPFGLFAHLVGGSTRFPSLTEMLVRLSDAVAARADAAPLLIAVDDGHLLDDGTAAFLHSVAAEGRARLLITLRSGATPPDAVTGLWKEGRLVRLDLQPLAPAEMDRLVVEALGGPVETVTRHRLQRLSAGNPLLLRELLLAGIHQDALEPVDGIWRWKGPTGTSDRLGQLIADRLADVTAEERLVIEALAVGEPLPVAMLEVGDPPLAVESLERRGVIVTAPAADGRREVRLVHPLYGEVVRAELAPLARRRLLAAMAERLLSLPVISDDDRFRTAVWRMDADATDVIDPGPELLAAQRALALSEYDLALRLASRAFKTGAGAPAQLVMGHALYWTDEFDLCDSQLTRLVTRATEGEVAEATIVRSSARFWGLDDVTGARELVSDTHQTLRDPASRALLISHLASLVLWSGDPTGAEDLAHAVRDDPASDTVANLRAVIPAALSAAVDGRCNEAVTTATKHFPQAMANTASLPLAVGELAAIQATAEWLGGSLVAADELTTQVSQWSLDHHAEDLLGIFTLLSGQVAIERGLVAPAISQLKEAVVVLTDHDPGRTLAWAWATLASALGQAGDAAGAAQACNHARESTRAATGLLDPLLEVGAAWAAAAEGVESDGSNRVMAQARAIAGRGRRAVELLLLTHAVRLGGAHRAVDGLSRLANDLNTPQADAAFLLGSGIVDDHAQTLDRASATFETAGALLIAAEAAAASATSHRRAGRRSSATAAANRSRSLLASCPGAHTPLITAARDDIVDVLTSREREIATLAARGMSSPEIATRLRLSERTVENHLARCFAKFGVNTRLQLTEVLSLPGT